MDVSYRAADACGLRARFGAGVVGNSSTFGAAIEVVNFKLMSFINGALQFRGQRSAGGNGEPHIRWNCVRFMPVAPEGRDSRQCHLWFECRGATQSFRESWANKPQWYTMQ